MTTEDTGKRYSVLCVCMGNICRSPTAQAMLDLHLQRGGIGDRVLTDSAGTHGYHEGQPPDRRAREAAAAVGLDIGDQRARLLDARDLYAFDHILVMDHNNLSEVRRLGSGPASVELFMTYAPDYGLAEVPDPYYGGEAGFRQVVEMLDHAAEGVVQQLREQL